MRKYHATPEVSLGATEVIESGAILAESLLSQQGYIAMIFRANHVVIFS